MPEFTGAGKMILSNSKEVPGSYIMNILSSEKYQMIFTSNECDQELVMSKIIGFIEDKDQFKVKDLTISKRYVDKNNIRLSCSCILEK